MPIRLCQKCGLKVLIDESQSALNPFYCQRCTTALKGQPQAADAGPDLSAYAATPKRPTPAATPQPAAARPATVRVLCPYCKASFNGRVPTKPARGACPVCQKELILLPDGDIKPAAGFDLGQYQGGGSKPAPAPEPEPEPASEPESVLGRISDPTPSPAVMGAPQESGTRMRVRKYASEAPPAPVVSTPAETQAEEAPSALPSWLDDGSAGGGSPPDDDTVRPQPSTDVALDPPDLPPPAPAEDDRTIPLVDDEPPPAKPKAAPRPAARPAASARATRPVAAVSAAPNKGSERRIPPKAAAAGAPAGGRTGLGLVMLAAVLALLPAAACPVLLNAKDKLAGSALEKLGARMSAGLVAMHKKWFAAPAVLPKPSRPAAAPAPKEEKVELTAEDRARDEDEINKLWMEFKREERTFKQKSVGATAAEKAEFAEVETGLKQKEARILELRQRYQKLYGADYDPRNQ